MDANILVGGLTAVSLTNLLALFGFLLKNESRMSKMEAKIDMLIEIKMEERKHR